MRAAASNKEIKRAYLEAALKLGDLSDVLGWYGMISEEGLARVHLIG